MARISTARVPTIDQARNSADSVHSRSANTASGTRVEMAMETTYRAHGELEAWVAALGYTHRPASRGHRHPRSAAAEPGAGVPELDALETERRRQRNRIHFELAVPSDLAETRLATTVAAGGRLLDESEDRWRVADPEGNEMVIVRGV